MKDTKLVRFFKKIQDRIFNPKMDFAFLYDRSIQYLLDHGA